MTIESNLRASFRDVKMEIIGIKNQLLQLAESQKELAHVVARLQKANPKKSSKKKKVIKKIRKKK